MLNQQDTKAQCKMRSALADPAAQQRGRIATLFKRLYSRQGTLTHKEFVWPAVYLLTLGKVIDSIMIVPLELVNVIAPVGNSGLFVKSLVVLYYISVNFVLFFYPLFTLCVKCLKSTTLYKKYYDTLMSVVLVFIYVHALFLPKNSIFSYVSGYLLCVVLVVFVYFLGKKFFMPGENSTD